MFLLAAAFLAPLGFTCAIMASESPVTHDRYVQLNHLAGQLSMSSLIVAVVAAWLLRTKPLRPLPFAGIVLACSVGTILGGVMIGSFFGAAWWIMIQVLL